MRISMMAVTHQKCTTRFSTPPVSTSQNPSRRLASVRGLNASPPVSARYFGTSSVWITYWRSSWSLPAASLDPAAVVAAVDAARVDA